LETTSAFVTWSATRMASAVTSSTTPFMNPPFVDPSLLTGVPMVRDAPRQARRTPSRSVPLGG
jgi:hypothetical protein